MRNEWARLIRDKRRFGNERGEFIYGLLYPVGRPKGVSNAKYGRSYTTFIIVHGTITGSRWNCYSNELRATVATVRLAGAKRVAVVQNGTFIDAGYWKRRFIYLGILITFIWPNRTSDFGRRERFFRRRRRRYRSNACRDVYRV